MRSLGLTLAVSLFGTLIGTVVGCSRSEPEPPPAKTAPPAAPISVGSLGGERPAPDRVVAIGDLHGDLDAAKKALRLAGAIDAKDSWIGGKLVVVQTGDVIDRGDDDRAILDLLERLKSEAKAAGGEVVALSGNHEIMNATFDFRYVTPKSFTSFQDVVANVPRAPSLEPAQRPRAAAFAPGGPYAKMIAQRPVIARVGNSIFVHGGVLPKHVTYGLDKINDGTRDWLLGQAPEAPRPLASEDGPLWTRMYSAAPGKEECATLTEALGMLKAKRMVMGHTVQKPGISPACDERAWRIDVGMSRAFGGPIQVLELEGDAVRVLKEGS